MFDPRELPDELQLREVAERTVAGRSGIQVRATPTGSSTTPRLDLTRGADEYQLVVDCDRGVLLRVVTQFQDRAFDVKEMVHLAFDEPLPADLFTYKPPPERDGGNPARA